MIDLLDLREGDFASSILSPYTSVIVDWPSYEGPQFTIGFEVKLWCVMDSILVLGL